MVSPHNITTKKDIVKPLQWVSEGNSITTPTLFGVPPTSPSFTAAGLNAEIDLNPDITHFDVEVLGSEDIVDAVKQEELFAFVLRSNLIDSSLLARGINVSGGGAGSIDESLSFLYTEFQDGVEKGTLIKGSRPTNTRLSVERGDWKFEQTFVCQDIVAPASTPFGLSGTPVYVTSIPTGAPLGHLDAGADPFIWNGVVFGEQRYSLNATRSLAIMKINGVPKITYSKPSMRKLEFDVDVITKNNTFYDDYRNKTARSASYKFSTSPAKTMSYTNCVIANWRRALSATITDGFIETLTVRPETVAI